MLDCVGCGNAISEFDMGKQEFVYSLQFIKCFFSSSWLVTLQARFSTNKIMEFLKSVAAVSGRLVTSVMLSLPSGHIAFRTGLELETRKVELYK